MKITFSLTKDDLLEFQLFEASKSPSLSSRRKRNRFLIPAVYCGIGLYIYHTKGDARVFGALMLTAVIWVLMYPVYSKWLYRKQFDKYISKNFDTGESRTYSLELTPDVVDYFDSESEGRFSYDEVSTIIELRNHFLLYTDEKRTIIVPKTEDNTEPVKEFFVELSTRTGKEIENRTGWNWK